VHLHRIFTLIDLKYNIQKDNIWFQAYIFLCSLAKTNNADTTTVASTSVGLNPFVLVVALLAMEGHFRHRDYNYRGDYCSINEWFMSCET